MVFFRFITTKEALRQIREEEKAEITGADQESLRGPLDPLLRALVGFQSSRDLSSRLSLLFERLDVDEHGALKFEEVREGLKKLELHPPILLSVEDWEHLTENGLLLNGREEMTFEGFERMVRLGMHNFMRRMLVQSMESCEDSRSYDLLLSLKMLLEPPLSQEERAQLESLRKPRSIVSSLLPLQKKFFQLWKEAASSSSSAPPPVPASSFDLLLERVEQL
ncbi:hypothetical protein GUITHDRAFT_122735, partial [Guillardia theta CCMP2712]